MLNLFSIQFFDNIFILTLKGITILLDPVINKINLL